MRSRRTPCFQSYTSNLGDLLAIYACENESQTFDSGEESRLMRKERTVTVNSVWLLIDVPENEYIPKNRNNSMALAQCLNMSKHLF